MRNSTIAILALFALIILILSGCVGGPQRTAFNTISSLELTAQKGVDAFFSWSIEHQSTNGVHEVSVKFNEFQDSAKIAAQTLQAGTNALAPGNLVNELTQLNILINQLKK